nr:50S ribosomal protein L29 [Nanoarchaeota archaeon]
MKFKELSQLSKEELQKKLKELELELIKLNAQVATGTPPKNTGQLRRLKKDLARIMLLKSLNEKKATQQKEQQLKTTESLDTGEIKNSTKKNKGKKNKQKTK